MGALLFLFSLYPKRADMKKTVVVGAGPESYRYGHRAVVSLMRNGIDVVAVGLHKGEINGLKIHTESMSIPGISHFGKIISFLSSPKGLFLIQVQKTKR